MASNVDEVIDEPNLDASNYTIFSDDADEIMFHYKLKFPGTYSIPTSKILDLLDNEVLFSHLENSVKSFVYHAREIHKINNGMSANSNSDPSEMEITSGTKSKKNLNILAKPSVSTSTNVSDVLDASTAAADLSVYDSVHSIKIPWSSYERVSLKNSNHTLFRHKKQDTTTIQQVFGPSSQADHMVAGLVFERVEKSVPSSVKRKLISPTKFQEKRGKRMLMSSDCQEVNNVIVLNEN